MAENGLAPIDGDSAISVVSNALSLFLRSLPLSISSG